MTQDPNSGLFVPELSPEDTQKMHKLEETGGLPMEIDRSLDFFFRYLLGSPARTRLLLDLLNSLFAFLGYRKIQKIELTNTELAPVGSMLKHSRLDIKGIDERGEELSVELQKASHSYFIPRCLYYLGKNYTADLGSGEDYIHLHPVLMIALLGFNMFTDTDRAVWDFTWANLAEQRLLMPSQPMQALFFVEMAKISSNLASLQQRIKEPGYVLTDLDRLSVWGSYFSNNLTGVEFMQTVLAKDKVFSEVNEAEKTYWSSPVYRYLQLREQMAEMDQKAFIADAEARGLTQGFEQGHANGFIEGTEDTKLADIENLMASEGFSATRAMNALKVPEDKRGIYLEKLKEREESEAALA